MKLRLLILSCGAPGKQHKQFITEYTMSEMNCAMSGVGAYVSTTGWAVLVDGIVVQNSCYLWRLWCVGRLGRHQHSIAISDFSETHSS